jgi:hypothetical protein
MAEVDDVIRRINAREPMSPAELRRAAELLIRDARVRVAVALEKLGE